MNVKHRKFLSIAAISAMSIAAFSGVSSAQTTTTKATQRQPGAGGAGRGGANRAFCSQVTDSQAVIAAAKGDAIAKLDLTAKEWVKIEAQAPTEIKPKVVIVRTGFQAAAKAKNNAAVKAQAVTDAGKAITTFVTTNCSRGPGGFDTSALTAYRDCLAKNGVTLPAPAAGGQPPAAGAGQAQPGGQGRRGGLGQLDPSDPKVAAAMKACQSKLPAGGLGGGGGAGGAGFGGGQALRDCLAKKKITFTPGQGGTNGQPDAKTQKAIEDCRAEAAKAVTTTTKKK